MSSDPNGPILRPGGVVLPGDVLRPRTGGWRTGHKPAVDFTVCVDCLLCWIHCPDMAVQQQGGIFRGFDYDLCKGCEVCVEVCPVDAITMVPEKTVLDARGSLLSTGGARNG